MVAVATGPPRRYVYHPDPLSAPPPAELAAILDRHRGQPDALITVLEEIQDHYGYLPRRTLEYVARELGFPYARLYGVATFYNLFRLDAPGRYQVRVCTGTACHVNRSADILAHLMERLGVVSSSPTPDGRFTLQTVACTGACSLAPVVVVGDQIYGHMTTAKAWDALAALRLDGTTAPAGGTP